MRYMRGLLVALSAGALSLGMIGTSQADTDQSNQSLDHSCQNSTFGSCTQEVNYAPEILGDLSLTGPNGLLGPAGLLGPSGLLGPAGLLGPTGTSGTTAAKTTLPAPTR
ncbi:hypothetical protein [Streptomyces sp. NBC_00572]|uniref:hypothetical protein n=1 Tax=Streptomyces sp. NBC_00572 TaxID=2903664 RepID=UPI00225BA2B6|nr:hypothetical protein [Streptomyces sp. NBC_00572]MCX4983023.1 hypothetical protein [Streptomyces sp. NBC_00572]